VQGIQHRLRRSLGHAHRRFRPDGGELRHSSLPAGISSSSCQPAAKRAAQIHGVGTGLVDGGSTCQPALQLGERAAQPAAGCAAQLFAQSAFLSRQRDAARRTRAGASFGVGRIHPIHHAGISEI